jgi:hypothetical protein
MVVGLVGTSVCPVLRSVRFFVTVGVTVDDISCLVGSDVDCCVAFCVILDDVTLCIGSEGAFVVAGAGFETGGASSELLLLSLSSSSSRLMDAFWIDFLT